MPSPRSSSLSAITTGALGVDLDVDGFSHDGSPLLGALRLRLEAGAITCLLGASGVGKSTLLRLLANDRSAVGALPPGVCIRCDDGAPLGGRVAWMDQRDLLLPWLNVLDNIMLGPRLRGEPPQPDVAHALLAEVGMSAYADASPSTLSTGMRQRVALARTLMERSPLVLMDEPFSALDVLTRHRLQAMAVRLLVGHTVLLVTHDPAEAVRVAHRVHVLEGRPARLVDVCSAPGEPPRDPTAPRCLPALRELQARLGLVGDDAGDDAAETG